MITLITAAPGGGKTAYTVGVLIKQAADDGRPVFVMGIPELSLTHFPVPPIEQWTIQKPDPDDPSVMLPYFTFPPNALIVLDEAQRVFRPRAAASKVPDHVAAFETHRHTGVDFVLITQHPNLLDSNIRNLVGRHVHLRDLGILGRWFYEWPEATDPKQFKTALIKKRWKLPKQAFGLYKSASVHVKRNYSMPPAMVVLLVGGLILAGGVTYMVRSISSKMEPTPTETAQEAPQRGALSSVGGEGQPNPVGGEYNPLDAMIPRHPNYPESAPAYDGVRQVKAMPQIVGCMATVSRCKCYTQQWTDATVSEEYCRSWIKSPPFNPYRDAPTPAPAAAPVEARSAPPSRAPDIGTAQAGPGQAAPAPLPAARAGDSTA